MSNPTTKNPISIVDNGSYVTFVFGGDSLPVDVLKSDTYQIDYYPLRLNNAKYPLVSMLNVGITAINYKGLVINCDHRFVTTPVTVDAPTLYNTIVGYFNVNPSVIVEVEDPIVIAEITDAGNWDVSGNYTGSTAGLVAGSFYYDTTAKLKYEFDGTTLIRIDFNTTV